MDKLTVELIGAVAVVLGLLSIVPQIWKTWRTRRADDLSIAWLVLAQVANAFGFAYVLLLDAWAAMVGNVAGFFLVLLLIVLKLRYSGAS
jgi:MtN3 and saliva related transmembrane protein